MLTEIHDSLSPAYSKFYFNNEYKAILGLSAGINKDIYYPEKNYTKGELLNQLCPIIYKYSVNQGQKDGTARKLKIFIIKHQLDSINKNVKAGNKYKPFYQTEESAYLYWDKQHKRAWFIEDKEEKELKIRITSTKRKNILYNLLSKIQVIKKLVNNLIGKSILFGNSLDSLLKITPNVVSSKNSNEQNNKIRDYFDKGLLTLIASFKKLKQGANLVDLDNCIIMSYYSNSEDFIQRIGRLRENNNLGYVFILITENTQEEIWFEKMISNIDNIDMIYCDNIDDCIKKYLNEKNKEIC